MHTDEQVLKQCFDHQFCLERQYVLRPKQERQGRLQNKRLEQISWIVVQ